MIRFPRVVSLGLSVNLAVAPALCTSAHREPPHMDPPPAIVVVATISTSSGGMEIDIFAQKAVGPSTTQQGTEQTVLCLVGA